MKKVFIWIWGAVGLFVLAVVLLFTAAFTTHATDFSGTADLHLKFETEEHKPLLMVVTDSEEKPVASETDGSVLLHPHFESRETNIFDVILGGPRPRTCVVSFFETGHKRHEITFTYDRHGHIWQGEVSFPDPSIAAVEVESSTLVYKGAEGARRRYESAIFAKALVGPPIIKND